MHVHRDSSLVNVSPPSQDCRGLRQDCRGSFTSSYPKRLGSSWRRIPFVDRAISVVRSSIHLSVSCAISHSRNSKSASVKTLGVFPSRPSTLPSEIDHRHLHRICVGRPGSLHERRHHPSSGWGCPRFRTNVRDFFLKCPGNRTQPDTPVI